MAKLVTGGTGYIAAELAHILVERGEEVVLFDIFINEYRVEDIKNKVKIVRGDLGNFPEVANVVKDNGVTEIYHMGGLLTMVSEGNPWASFRANVIGTYNVLEAARLFSVKKMMFTSSIGTYGLGIGDVIDDLTMQRPTNFYGVGKLYCEGLGRWYMNKFGLDFRSIRYPATVGPNVRTPGHWMPPMIEDAISGVAEGAIEGASDIVASTSEAVKNIVHSAIEGASEAGMDVLTAVRNVARGAVSGTAKVGGDIALASVAAVEGAVEAAGKVGADASEAVRAAVIGVIHAADNIGSEAGATVRKALMNTASLPRDVVKKAIGGSAKKQSATIARGQ